MSDQTPVSVFSRRFWFAYSITMRPYLLYVSGAAGAAGLAMGNNIRPLSALAAFVCFFFSYGFGQALTDCFQTDTDAVSSPYRPLVRGIVSRGQVGTVSLIGLLATACCLAVIKPWLILLGLLGVIGLVAYTPFKRTWWGGPPWNSWIVVLLTFMGWHASTSGSLWPLLASLGTAPRGFGWSLLAVFFGYANFVVMGYFKDISADRATNYRTFPVVFGWKANALYSDGLAFLAAGCTALAFVSAAPFNPVSAVVLFIGIVVNIIAQIGIHKTRDEHAAHGPIANVVRTFVLYALAIILAHQLHWIWGAIPFYVLFEITLRARIEATQV